MWDTTKLKKVIFNEIVEHIMDNAKPTVEEEASHKAWWMEESRGSFTVKSAFKIFRRKK